MRVLDILADGRQTVVPPTVHPSGCTYVWISEKSLTELISAKDLPQLAADFIQQVERVLAPYQTEEDRKYQKKHIAPAEGTEKIDTNLSPQAEYFRDMNRAALAQLSSWIPKLIPTAKLHGETWVMHATWRGAENPKCCQGQ